MTATSTTGPRLLDLFCCEGGAAVGYHRAGFEVVGVDIAPQPRYPFGFRLGDALDVLGQLLAGEEIEFREPSGSVEWLRLEDFAAVAASPPCQFHSTITPDKSLHVDLIPATRAALIASGLPYVIENVAGARAALIDPMLLCGSSFGLRVRRHRLFESNVWLMSIPCDHESQGEVVGVYGSHGDNSYLYKRPDGTKRGRRAANAADARDAMGMDWVSWYGATQAIPPAYTEFIGAQLLDTLEEFAA